MSLSAYRRSSRFVRVAAAAASIIPEASSRAAGGMIGASSPVLGTSGLGLGVGLGLGLGLGAGAGVWLLVMVKPFAALPLTEAS